MSAIVIGGIMAAASLLSSYGSALSSRGSSSSALAQSVYSAGLKMKAGEQEAEKWTQVAQNYYLESYYTKKKRDLSLAEERREDKITIGKARGKQQGLESDGTTRTMTVEQQEHTLQRAEKILKWDWDNTISRLDAKAREANYAADVAYYNGINEANATLYSGASTAAAYTNKANMTMAMAIPNAVVSGLSGYMAAGGTTTAAATSAITPGNYGYVTSGLDTESELLGKYSSLIH